MATSLGPRDLGGARALVTGASGFVGPHLCRALLATGASVEALIRPDGDDAGLRELDARPRIHRADIRDREAVAAALDGRTPHLIFNLARSRAEGTSPKDALAWAVNTEGVANLLGLAASRWAGARLVQVGTALETKHRGAYAESKAEATKLCLESESATVLRSVSLYGPGDDPGRLIPAAVDAAIAGRPLPLTSAGVERDWLYVDDLVEACLLAADGRGDGEAIELATGETWDNHDVARMVGDAVGRPVRTIPGEVPPRRWDRAGGSPAPETAARLLGWRPRTALPEGIARTVAWAKRMREAAVAG